MTFGMDDEARVLRLLLVQQPQDSPWGTHSGAFRAPPAGRRGAVVFSAPRSVAKRSRPGVAETLVFVRPVDAARTSRDQRSCFARGAGVSRAKLEAVGSAGGAWFRAARAGPTGSGFLRPTRQ
jgi:hypothetical protein